MEQQTGSYNESSKGQSSSKQSSGNGDTSLHSQNGGSFEENRNSNTRRSSSGDQENGLSDLAYNWISFVQSKAAAVKSYEQYIADAEEANSTECADLFREACKADQKQLEQAKQHLSAVLEGTM